eukprot:SAG11_NODE_657_length_7898_cov_13.699320_6_plen_80_part_00
MVFSSENRKRSQNKRQLLEVAAAARYRATVESLYDQDEFTTLLAKHVRAVRKSYAHAIAQEWALDEISSELVPRRGARS